MTDRPVPLLAGLAEIAHLYDGFVLDVWGVLHNGVEPYPGVVAALEAMNRHAKRIVLLSNAPMRADVVAARVDRIGVPRALFHGVMSSGEEVWQCLRHRPDPFYAALGTRCLWLGPDRHGGMVEGLGLTVVEEPAAAEFILNTGPDELDDAATALLPLLRPAAARGLPMVCANADLHVMQGNELIVCAGQVAKVYEAMGGPVRWHGKPFRSVYDSCLTLLGIADRSRILAVGDSLRTDIAGAAGAGLDSLLVAGGIHADEMGVGGTFDPNAGLERIGAEVRPTWVIERLVW